MIHTNSVRGRFVQALLAVLLLVSTGARAEVLVLIHGFLGDGNSFYRAGVVQPLLDNGWRGGGVGTLGPGQVTVDLIPRPGPRSLYTVTLPSQAPAAVQADWLQAYLMQIASHHAGEPITLVGHSAGGVVARLALVRYGAGPVVRLITIASPHLGTHRANQAMSATSSGGFFGPISNFFTERALGSTNYRVLAQSRAVLADLTMAAPGNLLGWLNNQPHPDIEYISIIRANNLPLMQDVIVPSPSQDMNRVPALRDQSRRIVTADRHFLSPRDGQLLMQLFDR